MLVGVSYLLLITMVYFAKFLADLEYFNEMEQPINQNHSQPRKAMFLPQMILKTTIEKLQRLYSLVLSCMLFICHSYDICMYAYVIRMSLVCHPYITCMY